MHLVGMTQISGFVDVVTDRMIVGWIVNAGDPSRLERVVCKSDNGDSLTFRACFQRQDVCDALGLRGRFGFAVSLDAIKKLGPVVSLTDALGKQISGGRVRIPEIVPHIEEPTFIVLHVQKSGGTSLRTALASEMRAGDAMFLYPDRTTGLSVGEFEELPVVQRDTFRLIMGHVYYGLDQSISRPSSYVTILREPMARLRSHFYHHVHAGTEFMMNGNSLPVEVVVQHALSDEFDNLMVRMLLGADPGVVPIHAITEGHVELALSQVKRKFRFVAITEHLDEHYPALCSVMGLPVSTLPFANVRRVTNVSSIGANLDWDEVAHHNRFDSLLYERVQLEGLSGRDLACDRAG